MSDWTLSNAAVDVLAERRRQVQAEGRTLEHDDQLHDGEMARAAACYALPEAERSDHTITGDDAPIFWPWAEAWWKPKSRRRDLVRSAALLLAEIERIDRVTGCHDGALDASIMPAPETVIRMHGGQTMPAMFFYAIEGQSFADIASEHGFDAQFLRLANDVGVEAMAERYQEASDAGTAAAMDQILADWQPTTPEGWTLSGQWHGEYDAIALFLRVKMP